MQVARHSQHHRAERRRHDAPQGRRARAEIKARDQAPLRQQGRNRPAHQHEAHRPRPLGRGVAQAQPVEHQKARNPQHHRLRVPAEEAREHPRPQPRIAPAEARRLGGGSFLALGGLLRIERRARPARIGHRLAARCELRLVIRQAQAQQHQRDHADRGKAQERPRQPDPEERQHHQRCQRRADHGAEAKARCDQGQGLRALGAGRARGNIGLHRRRRGAAEAAIKAARGGKGDQRPERGHPACQPRPQRRAAQHEGGDKADQPHRHHRLAPALVRAPRPQRRAHHPQERRPAIGEADPYIIDLQRRADRRHHRLHRGVARCRHQHHHEQQRHARRRDRAGGRRAGLSAHMGVGVGHCWLIRRSRPAARA